nr:T9SS type A sorting domain-containing protein [Bacteroidota bacterium]
TPLILTSYTSQTNMYFMFRFTSNGGNNVYIDDINISGNVGIEDEIANSISFSIYPNPAEEKTLIAFNLLDKQKVQIKVYNVLGQEITTILDGNLNAGEHEYSLTQKTALEPGAYFVKLTVADQSFTKKLIVN